MLWMSLSRSERSFGDADIRPDGFVALFMFVSFFLGCGFCVRTAA